MYLVKVINRANPNNQNFAGAVHIGVYGKNQVLVSRACDHGEDFSIERDVMPYFLKEYGYKRECDARRSYMFNFSQDERFWKTETSIIEIDA